MYTDITDIMGYNAFLNFVIGERGVGKTYSSKKYVIKRFLKTGEQFVYLRRYKSEIQKSVGNETKQKFFEQVANEFPEHKFSNTAELLKVDNKIAGYAIPLSIANILKSTSYEKVKTIIFDEFIIDKGMYHYLPNEVESLLDVIETVARLRDIKVIFLGNAISTSNPYFTYFDITLPYQKKYKLFKDGLILVYYIKNEKYREIKKQTRFGKLVEGTPYGKYAIDNEFLRDSKTFIKKKTQGSRFYIKLRFNSKTYGLWVNSKEDLMYVSYDYDINNPLELSILTDDHNENTILMRTKKSVHISNMLNYYRLSKLRFENQKIKGEFMQIISKYLTY